MHPPRPPPGAQIAGWMAVVGRPLWVLCARDAGRRHANNHLATAFGLGVIGVFWCYHWSLGPVFLATVVAELRHRIKPGQGVLTTYVGDCALGDWRAVGFAAVAAGYYAHQSVPPLGAWLMLSGCCVLGTYGLAKKRQRMLDDDQWDAMQAQKARATRIRGR